MDILVCIKQVPDPKRLSEVSIDENTKRMKRVGIPLVINPLDENAIEEALRIKEKLNGKAKISVISMGPPQTSSALRKALAMGVDDAFLLYDEAFSGADTLATAYTLAQGIKRRGEFDLILCGNETIDSGTGQVPPQIAEFLDISHVTCVREIEQLDIRDEECWNKNKKVVVKREIEEGYMRIELKLPAVLAVLKAINVPRYPTAIGIIESVKKEIKVWNAKDISVEKDKIGDTGSPTKISEFFTLEKKRKGKILKGKPEGVAKETIDILEKLNALPNRR